MIKFNCTNCGQHLDAGEALIGSMVECPTCNQKVVARAVKAGNAPVPGPFYIRRPANATAEGPYEERELVRMWNLNRIETGTLYAAGGGEWRPIQEVVLATVEKAIESNRRQRERLIDREVDESSGVAMMSSLCFVGAAIGVLLVLVSDTGSFKVIAGYLAGGLVFWGVLLGMWGELKRIRAAVEKMAKR